MYRRNADCEEQLWRLFQAELCSAMCLLRSLNLNLNLNFYDEEVAAGNLF